jgi:hypothetical protein
MQMKGKKEIKTFQEKWKQRAKVDGKIRFSDL